MGAWGPGLYQDDEAADLRNTISLLSKMPADGDRILEILLGNQAEPPEMDRDGGPTFWLVVADQFERRGIRSDRARDRAMEAIDGGDDLRDLEARDMDAKDLRKRAKVLAELRARLTTPRPVKPRPSGKKKPPMVVAPGEVWAFPTQGGISMNPWSGKEAIGHLAGGFVPDAWGALIILDCGRVYDWFPWCTYAPVAIVSQSIPTLDEVRAASTAGADYTRAVPRANQLKRVGAMRIGVLPLDEARVKALHIAESRTPERTVLAGWGLKVWISTEPQSGPRPVRDLLSDG
jgi:hypothetical protein